MEALEGRTERAAGRNQASQCGGCARPEGGSAGTWTPSRRTVISMRVGRLRYALGRRAGHGGCRAASPSSLRTTGTGSRELVGLSRRLAVDGGRKGAGSTLRPQVCC